jgi:hypothetical protein
MLPKGSDRKRVKNHHHLGIIETIMIFIGEDTTEELTKGVGGITDPEIPHPTSIQVIMKVIMKAKVLAAVANEVMPTEDIVIEGRHQPPKI